VIRLWSDICVLVVTANDTGVPEVWGLKNTSILRV